MLALSLACVTLPGWRWDSGAPMCILSYMNNNCCIQAGLVGLGPTADPADFRLGEALRMNWGFGGLVEILGTRSIR
jgi:hypothetical protein